MSVDSRARVCVLILNWNGWADTIECLESVFRLDHPNIRVIVCDNNSSDGSWDRIRAWADGNLDVTLSKDNILRHLSSPPVPKPIACSTYDRKTAESGGAEDEHSPLVLIQTGDNLGFAGGNNVGLRYALARDDFDFVWLLNNDAVVEPDSLTAMTERIRSRPDCGMCGSTLKYYDEPERVQAYGGAGYNKWFGVPRRIETIRPKEPWLDLDHIESQLTYVIGASMLVTREFLQEIGLMSEDYFLCFEELDWAVRSAGRFNLCYAPESIVYHKDGRSIGSPTSPLKRSLAADYYNVGNRLVFTRKYYRWAIPTVYIGLLLTLLNRARRRQWDSARMIASLMVSGCRNTKAEFGQSQRSIPSDDKVVCSN